MRRQTDIWGDVGFVALMLILVPVCAGIVAFLLALIGLAVDHGAWIALAFLVPAAAGCILMTVLGIAAGLDAARDAIRGGG